MKFNDVLTYIETADVDECRTIYRKANNRFHKLFKGQPLKSDIVKYEAWDMNMATDMELAILSNFPRFKKKTKDELERWAEDFRKMRTIDKRDKQEIIDTLTWALKDSFWKKNILSPGKFRIKFEQLMANAQGGGNLI